MELKAYLRILAQKWWVVLLVFLITYAATLFLTLRQVPVYQARATFVVKLSEALGGNKEFASALDILNRHIQIGTTYTEVANSRLIRQQAVDALGLSEEQRGAVAVWSELVPGTNVLRITTESPDPILASDFTNMVGSKTIEYVEGLYETYSLELLDQATVPDTPIRPNKALNLILGGIMGLVLGAGLAFLSAYLQAPLVSGANVSIVDNETGVYNMRYFMQRLRQELGRARRNNYGLSVALMNVDHQGMLNSASDQLRSEALRKITILLGPHLREEDLVARFSDTVFAFLLPDTSRESAREILERLQVTIAGAPLELERSDTRLNLYCSSGVASYSALDSDDVVEAEDLLEEAARALKRAEATTYGTVHLALEDGERQLGASSNGKMGQLEAKSSPR